MKKPIFFLILFLLLLSPLNVVASDSLTFSEVVDNLNLSKETSLHVKTYWEQVRDSQVTWKGVVKDVKGGRGRAEIYVANNEKPTYKGFNIILTSYDIEASSKLNIGDAITFTGRLHKYKGKKGRPVVLYLMEAQVL